LLRSNLPSFNPRPISPPDVVHVLLEGALFRDFNANLPVQVAVGSHSLPRDGLVGFADLMELPQLLLILPYLVGMEGLGEGAVGTTNLYGGRNGVEAETVVGPSDLSRAKR